MIIEMNSTQKFLNSISQAAFPLNILTMVFCVVHYLFPVFNFLYHVFGWILLITWTVNVLLLTVTDVKLDKNSEAGNQLSKFNYYYITAFIVGVLFMALGNFFMYFLIDLWIIFISFIIGGVSVIAILSIWMALMVHQKLRIRGAWNF